MSMETAETAPNGSLLDDAAQLAAAHGAAQEALGALVERLGGSVRRDRDADLTLLLLDVLEADLEIGSRLMACEVALADADELMRRAAASPRVPLEPAEVGRALATLETLARDVAGCVAATTGY